MANTKKAIREKSDSTSDAARSIVAAEKQARDRKTEKLRQLRLAAEAANPPVEAAPVKKRASSVSKVRQIKA